MGMKSFISERARGLRLSKIREIFEIVAKMEDVVRLEIGEPDFDTPANIIQAAKDALDDGYTHYTSSAGILELREAIGRKFARENGITVDAATQVVVTTGATSALFLTIQATVNPGEEVLLPDPGWPPYASIVQLTGATPVLYPLLEKEGFRARAHLIEPLITPKTKVLLINSPSNPTGAILDREGMEAICQLAKKRNLLVISDEVYERIVYEPHVHHSLATFPGMAEQTITVNSVSKTYAMTGWRIGFAAGPAEIIAPIPKLQLYANCHPTAAAQKACVAAYDGSESAVQEMVKSYQLRRDYMAKNLNELPGIKCPTPGGAFYLFPNIEGTGMDSMTFAKHLLEKGKVASVPGDGFGPHGQGYIRLCYAQSMEDLEKGVERMGKVTAALAKAGS
jgi:aspartate/methionine/tyrosine aminotransferase